MSITPEQAIRVGKILHPDWEWRASTKRMAWHKEGECWRVYDPTAPAECWAMVRHLVVLGRSRNVGTHQGLWHGLQDALEHDSAEELTELVLAYGGQP